MINTKGPNTTARKQLHKYKKHSCSKFCTSSSKYSGIESIRCIHTLTLKIHSFDFSNTLQLQWGE